MPAGEHGREDWKRSSLLFLFGVPGVLAHARAVFLQTQLFAAGLAFQRVVVIAGFFTDQEDRFGFFLALCHQNSIQTKGFCGGRAIFRVANYAC